ncbi:ATP adenylyltransferase [Cyanobium sp. ATX 6A2]|uniref:ATP adenylyltransferase n=1 Tax=Cyanobium sp. ATX 6A2 TaxID=2823700 RepID=UPI0020CD2E24|nr:ATP adenylyltransferase [Cyanobium sp. ATX 6A2]MCP9887211.1 ATP adenylyltransferase [Cyanobium sp. ATX 6A2]
MARAERIWQEALERSRQARGDGALVPLRTETLTYAELEPFSLRRLLSRAPKHLRGGGPKPNPFLPWEPELEVRRLADQHVVLLNKYPVQPGHVLVITQQWQPQSGWLRPLDWAAVAHVATDTGGLWFFNSCAAAGASQPHRHLQLLPRHGGEPSCPLAPLFLKQINGSAAAIGTGPWPWRYALSAREQGHRSASEEVRAEELLRLYRAHAVALELGDLHHDPQPRHPYNLLFDDHWFLSVRRTREHCAGFSLNALGFAGYLLLSEGSNLPWLLQHGPWELLRQVSPPARLRDRGSAQIP